MWTCENIRFRLLFLRFWEQNSEVFRLKLLNIITLIIWVLKQKCVLSRYLEVTSSSEKLTFAKNKREIQTDPMSMSGSNFFTYRLVPLGLHRSPGNIPHLWLLKHDKMFPTESLLKLVNPNIRGVVKKIYKFFFLFFFLHTGIELFLVLPRARVEYCKKALVD